jgi:hypothetical protein
MALETVRHAAGLMSAAAFGHHLSHDVAIQDKGRQAERRLEYMACGAESGTCGGEDIFSMRVLCHAGCNWRDNTPMLGMTGQTRVLLSNELLMESRR